MLRQVTCLVAVCVAIIAWSPALHAESTEPGSLPTEPVLTVNKNVGTGDVILSWTSTSTPYSIARDADSNPNDFTPAVIAAGLTGSSFADPVLNDGNNYFYLLDDGNSPARIYGRSATAGVPGASVTLTGAGFSSVLSNNAVFIGTAQATVTSATETTLTFTVPTQGASSEIVVVTPNGANLGGQFYDIGTDGLPAISSVAVDAAGTKFVATTGTDPSLSDRVFTFDPSTGSRTQVGNLGEATGLPTDEDGSPSNRVYYGNATINTANQGTINRTRSGGGQALYRACGVAASDPCYVWGIGLDPDLTDFGADGRVYVADGCSFNTGTMVCRTSNQEVLLVPPTGVIQTFASGFTFGSSPRGIVVDRDAASMFYHDVYISDSTSVYRYNSATVPGSLEMTYSPATFPLVSPRQMALTPSNRVRLLVADQGQGRIVMINPETNASKVLGIPLDNPRAIAIEHDAVNNVNTAWVGEPTRVLKLPVHRTVYISPWVAQGSGISETDVRTLVRYANASLYQCGIELQIRGNVVNFFNAGALLDIQPFNAAGTMGCTDPAFARSQNEIDLLDNATRRSSDTTDMNVSLLSKLGFRPDGILDSIRGRSRGSTPMRAPEPASALSSRADCPAVSGMVPTPGNLDSTCWDGGAWT